MGPLGSRVNGLMLALLRKPAVPKTLRTRTMRWGRKNEETPPGPAPGPSEMAPVWVLAWPGRFGAGGHMRDGLWEVQELTTQGGAAGGRWPEGEVKQGETPSRPPCHSAPAKDEGSSFSCWGEASGS